MPTTTIRIEESLKARVAAAAQQAGKTPHAFMLDAIADTVAQAEADRAFQDLADARWAEIVATGKTVAWDDARKWMEAVMRGENAPKPSPRKMQP